jgi:hypothetical protein
MKRFALFFAGLLCASLTAASAYAKDYDDVSVKVESVTLGFSQTGYSEYRAIIINHSTTKSHRVTIESFATAAVRRTVEVAPSSTMTIPMIMPPGFSHSGFAVVLIDGARQREEVTVDFSRTNSYVSRPHNSFFLLVSPNVDKSGLMNEAAVVKGFEYPAGKNDVAYLAYKSPMNEWSANWVAYSSFDGVVITAEELRDAPAAVRSALWSFAECGGSLLIISPGGAWEIPEQWRSQRINSVEVEAEDAEKAEGPGPTPANAATEPDEEIEPRTMTVTLMKEAPAYHVGFGKVLILDAAGVKSLPPAQWSAIKFGLRGSRPEEKNYKDIIDINKNFPVIEKIGIPVRGLFILMLVFVIVIGPINLIWLARKRRKIWMLWTVPAIALFTCLAVTGFALLGEGVSATSLAESFTILDESSRRASTIGWTAYYSPITSSEGLHFSYDTELTQIKPNYWRYTNNVGNTTVDLSNDQHLDSGWVTARVPTYFKFRKSETRRERLTIRSEEGGTISVVNGLGADVRELWLADRNGKIYSASGIRAGAEAKLRPALLKLAGNEDALRGLFANDDWPKKMKEVPLNPQNFLAPGRYLALLEANPFVEEGLKNVRARKGRALVYGVGAPFASATGDEK